MSVFDSPGETRFDSMSDYQHAIDALMQTASRDLCVFDADLRVLDFGSRCRAEQLKAFLRSGRANRLRIVLHNTDYVERFCPRVINLLKQFSYCMEIRRTAPDLQQLKQCYVLADDGGGVLRFHTDHARGKIFLGLPDESRVWREHFEGLWEFAEPGFSATKLGL